MNTDNLHYEVGKLKAESKSQKEELDEIKDDVKNIGTDVKEIKEALTKGKGFLLGLMVASGTGGAMVSSFFSDIDFASWFK